jgi:mono/diheme cytochrome c family protein
MIRNLCLFVLVTNGLTAATMEADSMRGGQLFETLICVQCHSINGKGGAIGPDLGRRTDRNFTPATLAATMWNHAPTMWASMRQRDLRPGDLDEQGAADLFAYFYSARFFERAGDAGRGKRVFTDRGCVSCHGLTSAVKPWIKPVPQWDAISDPMALAEAMWNHRPNMMEETSAKGMRWPALTGQDLGDILVYLRNLPSPPSRPPVFRIGAGSDGQAVFTAQGCARCHTSGPTLASRLKGQTLTDVAAAMWNHAPSMTAETKKPVKLEAGEMRELLEYLWAPQFFQDSGNISAGSRVFTAKHCASCHENSAEGAPKLTGAGKSFSGAGMVSVLWHHGPRMFDQMKGKGISWPRFEGTQMSDLIAFLNSTNESKKQ